MAKNRPIRVAIEKLNLLLRAIDTRDVEKVAELLRKHPNAARWQNPLNNCGLTHAVWLASSAHTPAEMFFKKQDQVAIVDLLVDNGGDLQHALDWIEERFDKKQKSILAQSLAGRPARLAEKFRAAVEKTTHAMGEGLARPVKTMHLFLRPPGPSTL